MTDSSAITEIAQAKYAASGSSPIQFPADMPNFFMSLAFYKYEYQTATGLPSASNALENSNAAIKNQIENNSYALIYLPIPSNLNDSFKVDYEQGSLGGLVGAIGDIGTAIKGGANPKSGPAGVPSTNVNPTQDDGSAAFNEGSAAVGRSLAKYLSDSGRAAGLGGSLGAAGVYELATGSALNPNLAVLFKGPTLKTHTFTWLLAPRNSGESQAIKTIIALVKRAMHPTRASGSLSAVLGYPCLCKIDFVATMPGNQVFLYPIRPVVVEQFNINYAPSHVPSFFQTSNEPTAVEITMQCQETSYYTRDSFNNVDDVGYDGFSESAVGGNSTSQYSSSSNTPSQPSTTSAMSSDPNADN